MTQKQRLTQRFKVKYYKTTIKGNRVKVNPFISLSRYFEPTYGITLKHIYCIRLDGDKIRLTPAPNQLKPNAPENKCFRAIVYKYPEKKYVTLRLSYIFLKKLGLPKEVDIYADGEELVLIPVFK